jgi:hypothetical protein
MAAHAAGGEAARFLHDAAPAKQSHADGRSLRRSASAPNQSGAWPHRSAAARPRTRAVDCDGDARSDPRDKQANHAAQAVSLTSAATTCRRSSARRRDVSPPLDTNNRTRHRRPKHGDQQVRDERYGEAPSGSSFDCEPSQTHSLEGDPDDLLSRPQPPEAGHLAGGLHSAARWRAVVGRAPSTWLDDDGYEGLSRGGADRW